MKSLLKAASVLECESLLIITRDEEKTIEVSGRTVNILPVWKWLLQ